MIVGINRRLKDGSKICLTGSRRGLVYTKDWLEEDGPIFLVEGGSDVAAGLTMGLCVVGRPSNTGGVDHLAKLLYNHRTRGRVIVAVGEQDKRSVGSLPQALQDAHSTDCAGCSHCWPGKSGARTIAEQLAAKLGRDIRWLLPFGVKDLRAWLNDWTPDPMEPNNRGRVEAARFVWSKRAQQRGSFDTAHPPNK